MTARRGASKRSAGVLLHRAGEGGPEVLLIHPGGPFWRGRDAGAWQIPKGAIDPGESAEQAALREAEEELGLPVTAPLRDLGEVRQAGGKWVQAFAAAQDLDADAVRSNEVELEWPRGSGRMLRFPEVDAARWLTLAAARAAMLPSQLPFLDRLAALLAEEAGSTG